MRYSLSLLYPPLRGRLSSQNRMPHRESDLTLYGLRGRVGATCAGTSTDDATSSSIARKNRGLLCHQRTPLRQRRERSFFEIVRSILQTASRWYGGFRP